jgi:HAD superfamily hydrolase (TIGR01549 family)
MHGIIFDLGSTLLHNTHDHQWGPLLPRLRRDLLAYLLEQGVAVEPQAFLNRFSANFDTFDRQRQTDFVEYTTGYVLNLTLVELGLQPLGTDAMAGALRAYYAYSETLWKTMPGAHEALSALQAMGLRLALASNAQDADNVGRLLDRFDLRRYLDPIIVSAAVRIRKPNPRIFDPILSAWGCGPANALMVGDTLGADILGAQLAGLPHIWLTAHRHHPANQAHLGNIVPEAEAESLDQVVAIVRARLGR